MLYFFFILFFISLAAIIFIVGRRLILIENANKYHHISEIFVSDILDFDNLKHSAMKNGRKLGHSFMWMILRAYILSSNFINKKWKVVLEKIKSKLHKHRNEDETQEKEGSKYIKIISEYKQKIKRMKHKIKEEEGIE